MTFTGVGKLSPPVCQQCTDWNAKWPVAQTSGGTWCFWKKYDGLPCSGTELSFEIRCEDIPGPGDVMLEVAIYENGVYMGGFHRTDVGGEPIDCLNIGLIGGFSPSGDYPDQCDWESATATVSTS